MSTRGTLGFIAHHLVGALQPLEDAFSDADSFRLLMLQLGWDAPGLPPSYLALAEKATQATAALEALEDDASLTEVLSVIDKAGAVYKSIKALGEAPQGIDASEFLPQLAPNRLGNVEQDSAVLGEREQTEALAIVHRNDFQGGGEKLPSAFPDAVRQGLPLA